MSNLKDAFDTALADVVALASQEPRDYRLILDKLSVVSDAAVSLCDYESNALCVVPHSMDKPVYRVFDTVRTAVSPSGVTLSLVRYMNKEYLLIPKGSTVGAIRSSLPARPRRLRQELESKGYLVDGKLTVSVLCIGVADSSVMSLLYGYAKSAIGSAILDEVYGR